MLHEAPQPLSSFQKNFTQTITHPGPELPLLENIVGGGKLTTNESLNVYRDDYRFRLCGALGDKYESVWLMLGDEDFQALAFAYIKEHPSTFRDLTSYGLDFPDFISENYTSDAKELMVELARFEKTFWELFHQPQYQLQNCNDLLKTLAAPEELWSIKWRLTPNLRFITSNWDLWYIFSKRKQTSAEIHEEEWQRPMQGLLFKEGIQLHFQSFTKAQCDLLQALRSGLSIAEFIESGKKINPSEIQALFAFLGQNQLILL